MAQHINWLIASTITHIGQLTHIGLDNVEAVKSVPLKSLVLTEAWCFPYCCMCSIDLQALLETA